MKFLGYLFGRDYALHKTIMDRLDLHDESYEGMLDKLFEQEMRIRLLESRLNAIDPMSNPNNPVNKPGDREIGGI